MPVYRYRCPNGHEFEELRTVTEGEACPCPHCTESSKRIPSIVSVKVIGGTPKFYHRRIG